MDLQVTHADGSVIFEFSKEARFDIFVVSNSREEVFWELKPSYLQPAPVMSSFMVGVRMPESIARALPRGAAEAEEADVPPVARVVYGEAPHGYREITKAVPLKPGERYALLFFDDRGESGGIHFTA